MNALKTAVASITAAGIAAACGPADAPDPEAGTSPATEVAMAPLPEEVIEELKERYPVLREEPAPEPRPNGHADPDAIPERVANALPQSTLQRVRGEATFYADKFEGRRTASGIPFRQNQMVAAHRSYPFGTLLRVTNNRNDRSVNVRVVDRGPFGARAEARGTIIDLSTRAAQQLGFVQAGRTPVTVEVLEWGDGVPTVAT